MQNLTTTTACDYCGARAGDRCVTATGRPATRPHAARTAAPAPEAPAVSAPAAPAAPAVETASVETASVETASVETSALEALEVQETSTLGDTVVETVRDPETGGRTLAPGVREALRRGPVQDQETALEAVEPASAPTVETVTPLREAIAAGIQQRGITTFRPALLTATIEVYTPDQSPEPEATIHYEGDTLTGRRDDRWGYIERESWVVETTWAEDADGLLDTLAMLVRKNWEITLIEIPEHIALDLAAAAHAEKEKR